MEIYFKTVGIIYLLSFLFFVIKGKFTFYGKVQDGLLIKALAGIIWAIPVSLIFGFPICGIIYLLKM